MVLSLSALGVSGTYPEIARRETSEYLCGYRHDP